MSDDLPLRLTFATQRVLGREVMAMTKMEWTSLILDNGQPTLLNKAPSKVENVMKESMFVIAAASGQANPDPGFDIVRYDPGDAPFIYNIDHYMVIERLPDHPDYDNICKKAGITSSQDLNVCLSEHVFVVKSTPSETSDHWSKELPHRICIARHKEQIADTPKEQGE